MQGLYNIAIALIPQIPWLASCYIIYKMCGSSPKKVVIDITDHLKIKMKRR